MNYKKLSTFLLLITQLSFGQTYKLEGKILDASNKSGLPFANISLEETTLGSASDADGRFSIEKINAGTYTVIASYMGYSTYKMTITIPNEDGELTILLEAEAIQLDEYVVTASRRRERIEDAPAAISVISKKEIRRESNTNLVII